MLAHVGKILHDLGENEMAFVLFVLFCLSTEYLPVDVPKTSRLKQDVLFGFSPWDDPQKIGASGHEPVQIRHLWAFRHDLHIFYVYFKWIFQNTSCQLNISW